MSDPDKRIERVPTPSSAPTLIAGADERLDPDATLVPRASAAAPARRILGQSGNALHVGARIGEFEITGLVGEGGFGIVYRAFDHSLERRVALKEYLPSSLAMRLDDLTVRAKSVELTDPFNVGLRSFVNEARLLAQFDHPALVKVFRFWEANGTAYMVMPFYEGVTLKQAIKSRAGSPDEAELRRLLAPLLDALEVVHRANCFHRDVAPDNVLLLADDRPVLLDFGAARRVIGDMTQTLTVILKPGYAPIEQYGESTHFRQGAWTDLYALGALLHYCIMGKPPAVAVARSVKDSHPPLTEAAAGRYSRRFLAAIDRALAPMPDERPQSIAEFREALGIEPSASRAGDREAPREAARGKRPWPVLAGGLVAIVVAAAVGYALTVDRRGPVSRAPGVAPVSVQRDSAAPKSGLPKPVAEPPMAPRESSPPAEASIARPAPAPVASPRPPPEAPIARPTPAPSVSPPAAGPIQPSPPPRERVEPRKPPPVTVAIPEKKPATAPAVDRPRAATRLQSSEHCIALINRAQLGEPMSAAELEYLKRECR
jgi:hypothetical protein